MSNHSNTGFYTIVSNKIEVREKIYLGAKKSFLGQTNVDIEARAGNSGLKIKVRSSPGVGCAALRIF